VRNAERRRTPPHGTRCCTVSGADVNELLRILGPSRGLALVTPKGGDDPSVPAQYRTAARQHPGRILVLDWERVSAGHPDWFAPDGIHLGGSAGISAFARLREFSVRAAGRGGDSARPTDDSHTDDHDDRDRDHADDADAHYATITRADHAPIEGASAGASLPGNGTH
jgi:hypothetical protein